MQGKHEEKNNPNTNTTKTPIQQKQQYNKNTFYNSSPLTRQPTG